MIGSKEDIRIFNLQSKQITKNFKITGGTLNDIICLSSSSAKQSNVCKEIISLMKNDDLQCSYVVVNRIDEHQNAELLNLDVTACNHGALQIQSTIQIDFVHNPQIALLHQQLNHKRIKIVPTPNIQKRRTLLQLELDYPALKKKADNHLAFDAELALKNSLVSGVDVIEPRLESTQESVNQILLTESTLNKNSQNFRSKLSRSILSKG